MRISKFAVFLGVTLSILCLFMITSAATAQTVNATVDAILSNPDRYDGKTVQVDAKVLAPKSKTSPKGVAFTTFYLNSNGKTISVFSLGTLPITSKDSVRVIGTYHKARTVGKFTVYNEIDTSHGSVKKL